MKYSDDTEKAYTSLGCPSYTTVLQQYAPINSHVISDIMMDSVQKAENCISY